jgi:hypothetical protein
LSIDDYYRVSIILQFDIFDIPSQPSFPLPQAHDDPAYPKFEDGSLDYENVDAIRLELLNEQFTKVCLANPKIIGQYIDNLLAHQFRSFSLATKWKRPFLISKLAIRSLLV